MTGQPNCLAIWVFVIGVLVRFCSDDSGVRYPLEEDVMRVVGAAYETLNQDGIGIDFVLHLPQAGG